MSVLFKACLAVCLLPLIHGAPTSVSWCYHLPSCSEAVWPTIVPKDCNGTQQSPVDIVTANVQANANLTSFNFTGYDDNTTLTRIKNTGKTIKVVLDHEKMFVEGGDLPGLFTSVQFHLHWGNGSAMPGSEHTVDGKQHPMELHIVNKAVDGSTVLAALGFFIEATNDTGKPESWKTLTSYLTKVPNAGKNFPPYKLQEVEAWTRPSGNVECDKECITQYISMDDLLSGVDRTKYYRYLGSLTTPSCSEGVVWTVFKDPIKVSQDLIDLFSTTVYIEATSSPLMTNNFRAVQPINGRVVTSPVTILSPSECQTEVPHSTVAIETDTHW